MIDNKENDNINLKLDSIDSLVLSEAIVFYMTELVKQTSMISYAKSIVLQGIADDLLEAIIPKAAKETKQQEILLKALKREREAKRGQ